METNAQQQTTWSGHRYLSSHSGWKRPGIKSTLQSFKKCAISNDLDGTEDNVLWDEQYDISDTDSEGEYYDMTTHKQIQQTFSEESDDDEFWGFESILLILVRLICGFDSRGVYWS